MKTNKPRQNLLRSKKVLGFSLMELIIGMAITSIIAALASQALLQTQNSFNKDQQKLATNQKTSSILEIIGREVRQAGELITDSGFPVIQVKPLTTTSGGPVSLIIYRGVSAPLPVCQTYPAGTAISGLRFAIDTTTILPCRVITSDTTATSTSLALQADWNDKRTVGSTLPSGKLLGMVGSSRTFQPFLYDSDPAAVNGTNSKILTIGTPSFTPSTAISTNIAANVFDNAYLVVKKEYLLCGTNLMVRINSQVESSVGNPACGAINPSTDPTGVLDIVSTNISQLTVNMITRAVPNINNPNPPQDTSYSSLPDDSGNGNNIAFPTTFTTVSPPITRDWQSIQGVIVNIVSINPQTGNNTTASFSSQGTFYPRNVLSTK
jgi:prepilin-type N-terminal cleavage/methylation domain-containing protein